MTSAKQINKLWVHNQGSLWEGTADIDSFSWLLLGLDPDFTCADRDIYILESRCCDADNGVAGTTWDCHGMTASVGAATALGLQSM